MTVNRVGSMLTPFFAEGPVRDYDDATRSDTAAYGRLARALLDGGRLPAALPVRGVVRGPRPRRRRRSAAIREAPGPGGRAA